MDVIDLTADRDSGEDEGGEGLSHRLIGLAAHPTKAEAERDTSEGENNVEGEGQSVESSDDDNEEDSDGDGENGSEGEPESEDEACLSAEQAAAMRDLQAGHSIFITGGGGVGKTFFISAVRRWCTARGRKPNDAEHGTVRGRPRGKRHPFHDTNRV